MIHCKITLLTCFSRFVAFSKKSGLITNKTHTDYGGKEESLCVKVLKPRRSGSNHLLDNNLRLDDICQTNRQSRNSFHYTLGDIPRLTSAKSDGGYEISIIQRSTDENKNATQKLRSVKSHHSENDNYLL